jgi:hypothetical protein
MLWAGMPGVTLAPGVACRRVLDEQGDQLLAAGRQLGEHVAQRGVVLGEEAA